MTNKETSVVTYVTLLVDLSVVVGRGEKHGVSRSLTTSTSTLATDGSTSTNSS